MACRERNVTKTQLTEIFMWISGGFLLILRTYAELFGQDKVRELQAERDLTPRSQKNPFGEELLAISPARGGR
jgi:hypothetical protein